MNPPSYTLDGSVRLFGLEFACRVRVTAGEPLVEHVHIVRGAHREPLPMGAVHGLLVPAGAAFVTIGQYVTAEIMGRVRA